MKSIFDDITKIHFVTRIVPTMILNILTKVWEELDSAVGTLLGDLEYIRGRTRLPREDVMTIKPISTIPFEFEIFW